MTQAANGLAEDTCDPFALIGRGASPGHMARPAQRLHLSAAASPRLCCNDRCNLQGRSCFPTRLRTFDELHAEALRPRVLTVRELFGRMLRQVKGVSGESSAVRNWVVLVRRTPVPRFFLLAAAERAEAILSAYPTPRLLSDAYDAQATNDARAGLLRGLAVHGQRNTLGPAISTAVHVFFNAEHRYPGAPVLTAQPLGVGRGDDVHDAPAAGPDLGGDYDDEGEDGDLAPMRGASQAARAGRGGRGASASSAGGSGRGRGRGRGGMWRGRGAGRGGWAGWKARAPGSH